MSKLLPSVQLYTVRDLTAVDFAGTMRELAAIGFVGVELAGFGNLKTASEVRRALDDAGLRASGAHIAIERLESELAAVIDEQRLIGNTQIIIPWLAPERRQNAADWIRFAQLAESIGQRLAEADCTLSYHNHDFEFAPLGNDADSTTCGFDLLYQTANPTLLRAELDVFWVAAAGRDPAKLIDKMGPRVSAIHLKDMSRDDATRFAEVGTGRLDFPAIVAAAVHAGVRWGVVEQDDCYARPPLESLRISLQNLKRMQLV